MSSQILTSGSLFDTGAQAIVNPVNCVGVMGKGLALEFKNRFPDNMATYASACRTGMLNPGGLVAVTISERERERAQAPGANWIVNLATKDHWRDPSRIEWIEQGAHELAAWARKIQVTSIACPALGAGLGGLPWEKVRPILEDAFRESACELRLFAPQGPAPQSAARFGGGSRFNRP